MATDDLSGVARDASTMLDVLADFARDGYVAQFALHARGAQCLTCREVMAASALTPEHARRLEGASDPDDMLMVLALVCPSCGAKGTLVVNYGPQATPEDDAVLSEMRPPPPPEPGEVAEPKD